MNDLDDPIESGSEAETSSVGSDELSDVDDLNDEFSDYRSEHSASSTSGASPSVFSGTTSDRGSDQPSIQTVEDKEVEEIFPSGIFQTQHYQEMGTKEFIENLTHKLLGRIRTAEGDGGRRSRKEKSSYSGIGGMNTDEVQNALHQFQRTQKHLRLFNSLFTSSVRNLKKHQHQSRRELGTLHKENQRSITKYMKELHECNVSLDLVSEQAKHLEEGLGEIGNQVIQTGHVLSEVNSQKERANDIKRLLDFFNEFNRYDSKEFMNIMKEKKFRFRVFNEQARLTAAVRIIQKLLNTIVPELDDLRNCRQGIRNVQTFHNHQLQYLLNKFSQALRKEDVLLIRRRYNILNEIGAYRKCETLFVLKIYNEFIGIEKTFVLPEDLQEESELEESGGEGGDDEVLDQDEVSDGYEKDIELIMLEEEEGEGEIDEESAAEAKRRKKRKKRKRRKRVASQILGEEDDHLDEEMESEGEDDELGQSDEEQQRYHPKHSRRKKKSSSKTKRKSKGGESGTTPGGNDVSQQPILPKEFDEELYLKEERDKQEKGERRRRDIIEKRKQDKLDKLAKKIEVQTLKLNEMLVQKEKDARVDYSSVEKFESLLDLIQKMCFPYRDMVEQVFGMENRSKVYVRVFETVIQRVMNKVVERIFDEAKRRRDEKEENEAANYMDPDTPVGMGGNRSFPNPRKGKTKLMEIELNKIEEERNFLKDFSQIYDICQKFVKKVCNPEVEQNLGIVLEDLHKLFERLFKSQKEEYIERELTLQDLISKVEISEATRIVKITKPETSNSGGKKGKKRGKADKQAGKQRKNKNIRHTAMMMSPIRHGARILGGDKIEVVDLVLERMLKVQHNNKDALLRCVLLSSMDDVHENVIEVFRRFIDFGHNYMVRGLKCSVKEFKICCSQAPFDAPPTEKLFDDISLCFIIMSKIQQHMISDVLDRLGGSYLLQNKCWKLRHELFSTLEIEIESGLKKMFTRIITYSGSCLKDYYNKNDYLHLPPKKSKRNRNQMYEDDDEDDFAAIVKCSNYVKMTLQFLRNQYKHVNKALFQANRAHFLEKMGLKFYKAFLRFLQQKVKVSQKLICPMKFKRDIEEFRNFFRQFGSRELDLKFEELRNLCGIVSVVQKNVESVCSTLFEDENIDKDLILIFVKMRMDFKAIKFERQNNVFGL